MIGIIVWEKNNMNNKSKDKHLLWSSSDICTNTKFCVCVSICKIYNVCKILCKNKSINKIDINKINFQNFIILDRQLIFSNVQYGTVYTVRCKDIHVEFLQNRKTHKNGQPSFCVTTFAVDIVPDMLCYIA